MRSYRFFAALTLMLAFCSASAFAQGFQAQTDRFSYSGTVTVYNTVADAKASTKSLGTYTIPSFTANSVTYNGRDLRMEFYKNVPGFNANIANIQTAWDYTANQAETDPYSGKDNPNNVGTGFFQLLDDDASTVKKMIGGWVQGSSYKQFVTIIEGQNAQVMDPTLGGEAARLWAAPGTAAPQMVILNYQFVSYATFGQAATNDGQGWYENLNHPISVVGRFGGMAVDASTQVGAKVYVFEFKLGMKNWAFDNRLSLKGPFYDSYFGSDQQIDTRTAAKTTWTLY